MSQAGGAAGWSGAPRVARRSVAARVTAIAGAALLATAAVSIGATSGVSPGLVLVALAALVALGNLAAAWGDRYRFDGEGFEYRNFILQRLGFPPRRVAWNDVERVWEHRRPAAGGTGTGRPAALFLRLRSGRRIVLDSLEEYEAIAAAVTHAVRGDGDDANPRR